MKKHSMKRASLAALLCLVSIFSLPFMAAVASAETISIGMGVVVPEQIVNYAWETPATRENGAPLKPDEIKGYVLSYSVDSGARETISVEPGESYTLKLNLPTGIGAHTVDAHISALDKTGLLSKPSNIVRKTFMVLPDSPPSSPSDFDFTIECLAGKGCTLKHS